MKILRLFSLCALLAILAGCGGLDKRQVDLLNTGNEALSAEDWEVALDCATRLLEEEPEELAAHLLRGKALFGLERYAAALETFGFLLEQDPDDPEMAYDIHMATGRCHVEMGRQVLSDRELPSAGFSTESRRHSRDFFLHANLHFSEALDLTPGAYDALLWRGYCTFRLENFPKAVEILEACNAVRPGRWEHRYFSALALEGMYKINTQSIETYLSIARDGPKSEMAPVYEHMTALHPRVTQNVANALFRHIVRFAEKHPNDSLVVREFLGRMQEQKDARERRAKLATVSREVQDLLAQDQFSHAILMIQRFLEEVEGASDIEEPLRDAKESWSKLLEARAAGLVTSDDRSLLERALATYKLSRELTQEVDRLVVLQQRINGLQLSLARKQTSRKIQVTFELLKQQKYEDVLEQLSDTSAEGLTESDRDLYHYMIGVSSFNLGKWSAATGAFRNMKRRDFEKLDAYHGLSLVKSGQKASGMEMLVGVPAEQRNDEINRLLGRHLLEDDNPERAVDYLRSIQEPTTDDSELHWKAQRDLGMNYYRKGDYGKAAERLQAACRVLESELRQRPPDVYLHLGNAHYRLDELERAKKVYQDLSNSGLTQAERKRCRDLYVHRAQIHLHEKHPDLAYRDFTEFLGLGGQLPSELQAEYGRLVATYGDFMPLDKIQYWNYVSTSTDYNYTLEVKELGTGAYQVNRREGGNTVSEETWWRQGNELTREVGNGMLRFPINLNPAEKLYPVLQYESRGMECTSEIVDINQTVRIPDRGTYKHCIKVRARKKIRTASGAVHYTKHIIFLAPGIGEVSQEIYRNDVRVSQIVLAEFGERESNLGN